jgi:hypothetical protein
MALIKPRTRGKQLVRHRTRLDHETNETLYAYANFIGESTEYVLNQVIDNVLGRDKEYLNWRITHADSFVPRAQASVGGNARVQGRRRAVHASTEA